MRRILVAIALLTLACVTSGCTFFTRGDDRASDPPAAEEEGEAAR